MTCYEMAKKYLSSGASVIPVGKDKRPLIKWEEFQKRRPTEKEIDEWWIRFPEANVAIVTGKISNLTVVDFENGADTSKFPTTDTVKTGNNGLHYYYQNCEGITNKARIFPRTDIRGEGGYVVAPPSVTDYEKDGVRMGGSYEISKHIGRAPFPAHLFGGQKPKQNWKNILTGVPEGQRNQTAASVAGKLLRSLAPYDWESVAWVMLQKWNDNNKPPLLEHELRTTFESIAKRELSFRRTGKENDFDSLIDEIPLTFTQVLDRAENELDSTKGTDFISFGYDWLDEPLVGLYKGELVIVGGESGLGKTTFTTSIVFKSNKKSLIFALEDRLEYYGKKALFFEINKLRQLKGLVSYPWNAFVKNELADFEYKDFRAQAKENLKRDNIFFYNSSGLISPEAIEKYIENQCNNGVELFLIDHLHYFDLFKEKDMTKSDNIERIFVRLRGLQRRTGARIIMVVHFKKLNGRKPDFDSFKDSVSISQNANYVINIIRERGQSEREILTEFDIPKVRNPNGEKKIKVLYDKVTSEYRMPSREELQILEMDEKEEKLSDDF